MPAATESDFRVEWRDLMPLSRRQVVTELLLCLPWLLGIWGFAAHSLWLPALGCAFLFFLTGLRQVHGAFHNAVGLSRRQDDLLLFALGLLMLGSMHAVRINHLRHHRHCLEDEDVEAMGARMSLPRVLAFGPVFPVLLHHKALQVGSRGERRWIVSELAATAAILVLVFGVLDVGFLKLHYAAMLAGQCMTAFFAVWTVHHDSSTHVYPARTIRGRIRAALTYNMFFHIEHHLYPRVPTRNLHLLAARLDRKAPGLASNRVL